MSYRSSHLSHLFNAPLSSFLSPLFNVADLFLSFIFIFKTPKQITTDHHHRRLVAVLRMNRLERRGEDRPPPPPPPFGGGPASVSGKIHPPCLMKTGDPGPAPLDFLSDRHRSGDGGIFPTTATSQTPPSVYGDGA
ncbi:hypothetical protein HanRHA438_Chr03g0111941 [Helianthus annuus]|nr:hypothetical protein HanIR_Chr03g0110121 [Helianthus annuus]KAJ0934818.1 hypothetical protein HanRHA438_Chr03g0111941 [Helianthus annuus]